MAVVCLAEVNLSCFGQVLLLFSEEHPPPHPPSDQCFSLYPRLASYCEYRISSLFILLLFALVCWLRCPNGRGWHCELLIFNFQSLNCAEVDFQCCIFLKLVHKTTDGQNFPCEKLTENLDFGSHIFLFMHIKLNLHVFYANQFWDFVAVCIYIKDWWGSWMCSRDLCLAR